MDNANKLVSLVEAGRLSIGRAAELLNVPLQDIYRLAEKQGVKLGVTGEQLEKSRQKMKQLLKKF